MAYAFVEPEYIEGNGKNMHIFPIRRNERGVIVSSFSCCGNEEVLSEFKYISICKNKSEVRATAADLQNSGKNVCGQCVATFYSR